jgi:Glycosyl transferase family 2
MKRKKSDIKKTIQKKIYIDRVLNINLDKINQNIVVNKNKPKKSKNDNPSVNSTPIIKKPKESVVVKREDKIANIRYLRNNPKLNRTPTIKTPNNPIIPHDERRINSNTSKRPKTIIYDINDYGEYVKKENTDYDVMLYVSSYNRYNKIVRILEQIFNQKTNYIFKVLVLNDGSTKIKYNKLKEKYPDIIYLKNEINGGKEYYWRTTNKIWKELKKYKTHALIQIDDDFILADNFINNIMDLFFKLKEENNSFMGIRYHYGHKDEGHVFEDDFWDHNVYFIGFDGGSVFDTQFMEMFEYELEPVDQELFKQVGMHSHVWEQINQNLIKHGILVHKTKSSLAWHDGNEDSKMHPDIRKHRKVHTSNFLNKNAKNDI